MNNEHSRKGPTFRQANHFTRRQFLGKMASVGAVTALAPGTSLLPAPPLLQRGEKSSGLLAFSATHSLNDRFKLYLANLDGSGVRHIPGDPGAFDGSPSWSPYGRSLIFSSYFDTGGVNDVTSIYRLDLGGSPVRIVREAGLGSAEWLADGTHILCAYSPDPQGAARWFLVDRDGNQRQPLFGQLDVWNVYPSSDGLLFAATTQERTPGFVLIDRDGHVVQEMATAFAVIMDVDWAPDGEMLAFAATKHEKDDTVGVYVLHRRTGAIRRVGSLAFNGSLAWSPDSKYLAFTGEGHAHRDVDVLYVADRAGSQVRPMMTLNKADSSGEIVIGAPAWGPHSRAVAINTYGSNKLGAFEIDIYSVRGVRRRRLTFAPHPFSLIYDLAWQPSAS